MLSISPRQLLNKLTYASIAFVGFLACAEVSLRFVSFLVNGPKQKGQIRIAHPELGWSLNPNQHSGQFLNMCDESVNEVAPISPFLIRAPANRRGVVALFIGDSYTHGHEVSAGEAYYDVVEELADGRYSVYASGVSGYGTLQELLLLEEIHSEVQPDIVVWQLCSNDVLDNVFELDRAQFPIAPPYRRPYLEPATGSIEMRNPGSPLLDVSFLARFLMDRTILFDFRHQLGILETLYPTVTDDLQDRAEFERKGLAVMQWCVSRAVDGLRDVRFVGFSTETLYDREYEATFLAGGAAYFPGFGAKVAASPDTDCMPADPHWNHKGNHIAAELLLQLLDGEWDRLIEEHTEQG